MGAATAFQLVAPPLAHRLYTTMEETQDPLTLHVAPLSARAEDRWRLSDPYIEQVWSEHLGPTATLLARRLG